MRKKPRRRRRSDRGLTLLEMMIVLALVGLLAAVIGQGVMNKLKEGRLRTARLQVREVMGTVTSSMLDDPTCATVEQLVSRQVLRHPPRDPWGTPLTLRCPSENGSDLVDVSSAGPDKKEGTEDDIQSWKL
jgi:general secretion pathway protein G